MFAHRRVALAGGGGSGGRCGWKLRSREAGLALTHARKACRQAKPPQPPGQRAPLSRSARFRNRASGPHPHTVRRCRALWQPAGIGRPACAEAAAGRRAGQLMRLSCSHPFLLYCPAERMARPITCDSPITCNAQHDILYQPSGLLRLSGAPAVRPTCVPAREQSFPEACMSSLIGLK